MKDFETWFAPIALIASAIASVITIFYSNRSQKREITFTGTPVDKKDFELHQRENRDEHEKFLARLDAVRAELKADRDKLHFRINPIEAQICALRETSEGNAKHLVAMEAKIDRLIERI